MSKLEVNTCRYRVGVEKVALPLVVGQCDSKSIVVNVVHCAGGLI